MVTFQPHLQDQQFTQETQDTSLVDAFHEKAVIEVNEFKTKDVQLDSVGNLNEIQSNPKVVLVTQLTSTGIITSGQVDEVAQ